MSETRTAKRGRRGHWKLVGGIVGVGVLLAAGWGAALAFQSPAQVEANRQAPPPSAVTAPVSEGELARVVSMEVTLARQTEASVAFLPGSDRDVVTGAPLAAGGAVGEFTVVSEVNDRPRFALSGAFPFYRDLMEGDTGSDVRQLQAALSRAGYSVSPDGRFGTQTTRAVTELYKQAGYSLPTTVAAQEETTAEPSAPPVPAQEDAQKTPSGSTPQAKVPLSELMVFPQLPAHVVAPVPVGTVLTDATKLSVGAGAVVAVAEVDAATAAQIRPDMKAALNGIQPEPVSAAVAAVSMAPAVASTDAQPGKAEERWKIMLSLGTEPSADKVGASGVALVTVEVAAAHSLLVPTSAIVPAGRGNPHVLKHVDGVFTRVEVRELGALDGKSAVEPVDKDALVSGDEVKVG